MLTNAIVQKTDGITQSGVESSGIKSSDLRNESRPPNCGHILSSSPICGHCLDGYRRALCLEKEWSSLTHVEGWEKWGKETGAIWKVLKETALVAGGPSRGGGHTVPPEITAVFGRVKTTHEVPGTRAQPISGRSWQCGSISDSA